MANEELQLWEGVREHQMRTKDVMSTEEEAEASKQKIEFNHLELLIQVY